MKTEGVCSPVLSGGTEPQPVTAEELGKVIAITAWNGDTLKLAAAILEKYEVRRK